MDAHESDSGHSRQIAGVKLGFFVAIIAADLPRSFLVGIAPLILSAFVVDRGFGEQLAAWLSSAELLAAAVAAIAMSNWLTRGSRWRLAAFGLALVITAQLLSILRLDFVPLLALRAVAGIGAGFAGAAATAAAAGSKNPERLFGAMGFVVALIGAATAGPIGIAISIHGASGAFIIAAGLTAIALPMLRHLSSRRPDRTPSPSFTAGAVQDSHRDLDPQLDRENISAAMSDVEISHTTDSKHETRSAPNTGAALVILLALFLSMLGQNSVWSFTVQIGLATGLEIDEVSWVLGLTALTGLGGAALATVLNTRRGRTGPLLVSVAGTMISVYALIEASTALPYIIANGAWSFFFAFSMPYFIGGLATLDPRGRWATIGSGLAGIGGALGPAVTGGLVETHGYSILRIIVIATGVVAAILLTPVLRRIDRGNFQ